jgi:hypothetical protein
MAAALKGIGRVRPRIERGLQPLGLAYNRIEGGSEESRYEEIRSAQCNGTSMGCDSQ